MPQTKAYTAPFQHIARLLLDALLVIGAPVLRTAGNKVIQVYSCR